jgi:secondary thiamine-phosphate synthase enzyme
MPVHAHELVIETGGRSLIDVTARVDRVVKDSRIELGLCNVFIRHTSASLIINENADPDVQRDLMAFLGRLVPPADDPGMGYLRHRSEGPDDMPAHIKAALLPVSLQIPVEGGRMSLGTWQGIYLVEHRTRPRRREVAAHLA